MDREECAKVEEWKSEYGQGWGVLQEHLCHISLVAWGCGPLRIKGRK